MIGNFEKVSYKYFKNNIFIDNNTFLSKSKIKSDMQVIIIFI